LAAAQKCRLGGFWGRKGAIWEQKSTKIAKNRCGFCGGFVDSERVKWPFVPKMNPFFISLISDLRDFEVVLLIAKGLSVILAPRKSRNDSLITDLRIRVPGPNRWPAKVRFWSGVMRGTGIAEVDHGMSMRRNGIMIGKLGEEFLASVSSGLG
jgi:hypothetical protein